MKIKIGRKSYEVYYDWSRISELQESLGESFDEKIGTACLNWDMDVLATALSIGTGLDVEKIKAASPSIVTVVGALTAALNKAFHGTETPKETFLESLVRKWRTLYYRLGKRPIATA